MSDDLQTRVARAMYDMNHEDAYREQDWATEAVRNHWLKCADAALAALGIPRETLEKLLSGELIVVPRGV